MQNQLLDGLYTSVLAGLDHFDAMGFSDSHTGSIRREVIRRARRLKDD